MTVGDLMMELLNATTTGGVPESAPVMMIAPARVSTISHEALRYAALGYVAWWWTPDPRLGDA